MLCTYWFQKRMYLRYADWFREHTTSRPRDKTVINFTIGMPIFTKPEKFKVSKISVDATREEYFSSIKPRPRGVPSPVGKFYFYSSCNLHAIWTSQRSKDHNSSQNYYTRFPERVALSFEVKKNRKPSLPDLQIVRLTIHE